VLGRVDGDLRRPVQEVVIADNLVAVVYQYSHLDVARRHHAVACWRR